MWKKLKLNGETNQGKTLDDLYESLGWIIGSALAGVTAVLSWMFESGFLSTLVGIIIGA